MQTVQIQSQLVCNRCMVLSQPVDCSQSQMHDTSDATSSESFKNVLTGIPACHSPDGAVAKSVETSHAVHYLSRTLESNVVLRLRAVTRQDSDNESPSPESRVLRLRVRIRVTKKRDSSRTRSNLGLKSLHHWT